MKAVKYDSSGAKSGEIELPAQLFIDDVSDICIYDVIRTELRNRRRGTHKTKTISEVRGGGKKPYRQKGTGHARQGSQRSPQFKGGSVIFGPRPRDYRIKLSKKMRKAGIRAILSKKAVESAVCVLEDFKFKKYSTKTVVDIFKKMGFNLKYNNVAFIAYGDNKKLEKSTINIQNIDYVNADRLTAPELFYSDHIVILQSALDKIVELFAKTENNQKAGKR